MPTYPEIDRYIAANLDKSLAELSELCAQPSVAAQGWGLEECAALVVRLLQQRGFQVKTIPTGGAPVIVAERRGRSARTLLLLRSL